MCFSHHLCASACGWSALLFFCVFDPGDTGATECGDIMTNAMRRGHSVLGCHCRESLLEMERVDYRGRKKQGAITLVLCWYFEHQRRVVFEGSMAEPLQTITTVFLGSEGSCLLFRIVLQDALSEVTKVYPPFQLKVFMDV